jgi:hypothetical protein
MELTVLPQDWEAESSVLVKIDRDALDVWNREKKIVDRPIPGASVEIPEIFSLGPSFQFVLGAGVKTKGGISFRVGMRASLPGSPRLNLDLVKVWRSSAEGFEGFSVEPIKELDALATPVEISLAVKPKLVFGIDILGKFTVQLALIINLPELKGTLTPNYSAYLHKESGDLSGFI